jgi:predicted site-specific integrase-resolvase
VLNQGRLSPEEEMVQDLMTIVHCFSSRLYGLRNYRKKLNEALKLDAASEPQVQNHATNAQDRPLSHA